MICMYLLGKMPQVIIVGKYVVELFSPHTFFPMSSSSANASSPLWIYHFQLPNFPYVFIIFIHVHTLFPKLQLWFSFSRNFSYSIYHIDIYPQIFQFLGVFRIFFPFKTKRMPSPSGWGLHDGFEWFLSGKSFTLALGSKVPELGGNLETARGW